jgi:4-hydroxy-2-oxoheptanedioate aldolase
LKSTSDSANGELPGASAWMIRDGRNLVVDRLANGEPVLAIGVRISRTVDIAKIARTAGCDVLWVDLEHTAMSIDMAAQICSAAMDAGLVPMARIAEGDLHSVGRLLDGGVAGILAPRVETVEQAERLAAACRFPPHGVRSQIGALPLFGYSKLPARQVNELANQATFVAVTIESALGFRNLPAIAAVEGIDIVISGNNDFSADLGMLGDFRSDAVQEANTAGIKACAALGKPFVVGGISDIPYLREMVNLGAAPFFVTGFDSEMLRDGAKAKADAFASAFGSTALRTRSANA